MLVPKWRDVLIEQMPALKLWLTIKLKRHRPMFVECTLALSGGKKETAVPVDEIE